MRVMLALWASLAVACTGDDKSNADANGQAGATALSGSSSGGAAAQGGSAVSHGGTPSSAGTTTGDAGETSEGGSATAAGSANGGSSNDGGTPTAGGADPGPDCSSFNDTFAGTSLDPCWSVLNGTPQAPLIGVSVSGGALHLVAQGNLNGVWYQGSTKSLVFKLVTESAFKVTTTVRPRKATNAASLPTKDLHVGGLMLRDPASQGGASERYLLFMAGHSENNNGVVHQGVEVKSTVNGCSNWNEPDWGASATEQDAELRVCRIGEAFRFYKRVPGANGWTPATPPTPSCAGNVVQGDVLTRADLPGTLQVGVGLNFSNPSDLDVAFDAVQLVALPANATAADCISD